MVAAPSTFTEGFVIRDNVIFHDNLIILLLIFISGNSKLAATSRAGSERMALGKGRGHLAGGR
jgi:hypothetical protein